MARNYFGGFTDWPDRRETTRYMQGECGYAALALSSLTGWPMVNVRGRHYVVRDPEGMFWDIRGRMDPFQVFDGMSPGDDDLSGSSTREDILQEMSSGLLSDGPFAASRLRRARTLFSHLLPEEVYEIKTSMEKMATAPSP
jgi:hypothetical protein